MKTLIIIILFLIFVIFSIYLSIIIKVKINITSNEAILRANIIIFGLVKSINKKIIYAEAIKKIINKHIDNKKNDEKIYGKTRFDLFKKIKRYSLYKPFFVKNINFYSECYEDKVSFVIEFSVVNILIKRGILSE